MAAKSIKEETEMELLRVQTEYTRMFNERNAIARRIVQMKKDGKTVENWPELKSLEESFRELEREIGLHGFCIDLMEDSLGIS